MKWRDKLLCKILLIVAEIICNPEWKEEITNLRNHIAHEIPEQKEE